MAYQLPIRMICMIKFFVNRLLNGKTTDLNWYYSILSQKLNFLVRNLLFMPFVNPSPPPRLLNKTKFVCDLLMFTDSGDREREFSETKACGPINLRQVRDQFPTTKRNIRGKLVGFITVRTANT